jgi:hypothetical protein
MWFFVQQDNRGLGNFLCSKYLHLFLDNDAIDETTTSTIGDESIITTIAPFEKEPRSNWGGGGAMPEDTIPNGGGGHPPSWRCGRGRCGRRVWRLETQYDINLLMS